MTTFEFVPSDEVSRIRSRLDHPIVDGDGHLLEALPLVFDYLRDTAGDEVVEGFKSFNRARFTSGQGFLPVRVFHGVPAENTLDRMTVTLPGLHYARLDEIVNRTMHRWRYRHP